MTKKWIAVLGLLLLAWQICGAQAVPGSMPERWVEGAPDCTNSPQNPLQVHAYEPRTFILRQSLCANYEGNFLYLLIGSEKALLIDTGAVSDPAQMPLAETVLKLLPGEATSKLPLLIAHTHGHRDHRAGDSQFESLPFVDIVPVQLAQLQAFFGFDQWPEGVARLDLGDRTVEVMPAPGHHATHLLFYDDRTQLLFSGDFLLPGRLIVADIGQYRKSAARSVDFIGTRPVRHILGGHIELDANGELFAFESQFHPNERALELDREDLLALPAALEQFNGFYAKHPNFVLSNPERTLTALAAAALAGLIVLAWGVRRLLMRRRRKSRERAQVSV